MINSSEDYPLLCVLATAATTTGMLSRRLVTSKVHLNADEHSSF